MAVKDKKFYWLKLKTEFMTGDTIDFLMSQKNGADYVVLYQMLCVKTINTQGELATKIGDILIPFDIDKIQRECKWFERDTVIVAMELYKKLGLLYEQENGIIKIADFENIVGSETYWAQQKRISRADKNTENIPVGQDSGQALENVQEPLYLSSKSKSKSLSNSNSIDYTQENNNDDDSNIYNINNSDNSSLDDEYNEARFKEFTRLYKQVVVEAKDLSRVYTIDWGVVLTAFEKSWYLRNKCSSMTWVLANFAKIARGEYDDKDKPKKQSTPKCASPIIKFSDEE